MSKNTNDWLVEDLLVSTQVPTAEKRSRLRRVLQNPFSIVWSKLAALFQASKTSNESEVPENSQSEQHEPESIRERYLYTCFTDRVDPSLYYILFFPHPQPQINLGANSHGFSNNRQKADFYREAQEPE